MAESEFARRARECGVKTPCMVFVGGGNMARALISGAVSSGYAQKAEIAVSVKSEESAGKWKKDDFVNVFTSNSAMLEKFGKGIVFLCVKPQIYSAVVSAFPAGSLCDCALFVSIMAAVKCAAVAETLRETGYSEPVVRLAPSTPCLVGESASLVACSTPPSLNRLSLVTSLASKVGTCTILDEKVVDAGAAIAGCGPAFVFLLIEAMADGGVLSGLSRADSMKLAAQTFVGAARLVQESGEHPGVLKDRVCSAGGTTIAGVRQLEKAAVRSALIEAVRASTERASQL